MDPVTGSVPTAVPASSVPSGPGFDYLEGASEAPVSGYNFRLPKKSYKLKCIDATKKTSTKYKDEKGQDKGGHPQIARRWEIIEPEFVIIPNPKNPEEPMKVAVAGLQVMDNVNMTKAAAVHVVADSKRLGVEIPNAENTNTQVYIGKIGNAMLETKVEKAVDEETKQPILNPDGTERIDYKHQIAYNGWLG